MWLLIDFLIVSDNPDYDTFGFKRINDITKDAGPVSGIYSGLEASSTKYNLILSCDIPLITSEILKKLIEGIDKTSEIIQMIRDDLLTGEKTEPEAIRVLQNDLEDSL